MVLGFSRFSACFRAGFLRVQTQESSVNAPDCRAPVPLKVQE